MGSGHNYAMLKRSEQNGTLRKRDSTFNRNGQFARLRRYRKYYKARKLSARQMQKLMAAVYARQEAADRAAKFTIGITFALVVIIFAVVYWWWVKNR